MADLMAATSSTRARVTDPDAVEELCDSYSFEPIRWQITDQNEIAFWGYETFNVFRRCENGDRDEEYGLATREFLWDLAEYITEGEELDIQIAGYTKFRFPMHAERWIVRLDEVRHADLYGNEAVERPGAEASQR